MIQVTAYKVDCCRKAYLTKQSAKRHEKICLKHPNQRACFSCQFWEEVSGSLMQCEKDNSFFYNFQTKEKNIKRDCELYHSRFNY